MKILGIISRCWISSFFITAMFICLHSNWEIVELQLSLVKSEFDQSKHTSKKCVNKKWRWQKVLWKFIRILKSCLDFYFRKIVTKWDCFCDVWTCKLLLNKLGIFPVYVSHVNVHAKRLKKNNRNNVIFEHL